MDENPKFCITRKEKEEEEEITKFLNLFCKFSSINLIALPINIKFNLTLLIICLI